MMVLCLAHTRKNERQVRNSNLCGDGTVSSTFLGTLETAMSLKMVL